jgi:ABC-type dipeptide/oligopeptide/nickel transport system permease component
MTLFFASRAAALVVTILGLSVITFVAMNLIPGGPFATLDGGGVSYLSPETVQQLRRQYGLDRPLWEQYFLYAWSYVHGDLGRSIVRNEEVARIIRAALPASVALGALSLLVSVGTGVPLGVFAAVHRNTWVDRLATVASVSGITVPGFVLGLLLIIVFSVQLGKLPVAGWGTWGHVVLPVIALSAEPIAVFTNYTRSAVLETLNELYVTVARSKGLPERVVVWKHAFRNALMPVVTVMGLVLPRLLVGSFLIETIFAIPGTGRLFVLGVSQRDYPLVMAMAILYAGVVAVVNLVVDVAYFLLNPRLRYA